MSQNRTKPEKEIKKNKGWLFWYYKQNLTAPLSDPNTDRGYLGVDGILILSVRYWLVLTEPDTEYI